MVYFSHMQKNVKTGIAVAAAIAVVALFFVFGNPLMVFDNQVLSTSGSTQALVVQDETIGTGAEAGSGSTVFVHYTGKLEDGTVFDTSVGRDPISFQLGGGYVIPGWDQGIVGMKVGGKRLLIIPPDLGYGSQDYGPIPANSTLIFEVELVSIQ